MSDLSDRKEPGADALLDLLYGELEGDAEAGARARVERDPARAGELAALEEIRALFSSLPEEEPPAAISAKLLAAAAAEAPAPERAGIVGWMRRLVAPLLVHPGLAAAASLLLVAGVAGAFYASGRELARPVAPSSAPAPSPEAESSRAPAAEAAEADEAAGAGAEEAPGRDEAAPAAPAATPARPRAKSEAKQEATRRRKAGRKRAPGRGAADRPARAADTAAPQKAAEPRPNAAAAADRRFASPPPPAEDEPRADAPAEPVVGGALADDAGVDVRALHEAARRAASADDCEQVRRLTRRVRAADADYHDAAMVSDERLRPCLGDSSR